MEEFAEKKEKKLR
jgi:hypothetical protein